MHENFKHCISILLAEDNPVNQKLTSKLLTKAGHRVDIAANGREAVDLFINAADKYDVILMDVQMPEMSGLDATITLRNKGFIRIPIIAVTAHAGRAECLKAGMNDFIAKPIKSQDVLTALDRWVIK